MNEMTRDSHFLYFAFKVIMKEPGQELPFFLGTSVEVNNAWRGLGLQREFKT